MVIIKPFKAIRPAKDKVTFVVSRSYNDYDKKERNCHLQYNPFSFLHIINPNYKFEKKIMGSKRFALIRDRYLEFLEEKVFIKDSTAGFCLYQTQKNDFKTLGVFCATSVIDYQNNVIKKHEDTLKKRKLLFTDYLKNAGFSLLPIIID